MKHLIKDLEWSNGKAVTPFTEYGVMPDGDKWKVKYFNKFDDEPVKDATGHITKEAAIQWANDNHKEKMTPWLNHDPLTETVNWFKAAKSEPVAKDFTTQVGCLIEEVAELYYALGDFDARPLIETSNWLKTCPENSAKFITECDMIDVDTLDALADVIVTAVGSAHMMGFDIIGAWFIEQGLGAMKQGATGHHQTLFTTKGQAWVIEKLKGGQ